MPLLIKNLPANGGDAGDASLIPQSGISPGVGNGNMLQYSCLENSRDRLSSWAIVHGVKKNQTSGLPWWLNGKESTCQSRRRGFDPWVGKIPWRRKWQPTLIFLPGKSHGQRSLIAYSPRGYKSVRQDLATK